MHFCKQAKKAPVLWPLSKKQRILLNFHKFTFYSDVFSKSKTCSNHEHLIIEKYRQRSLRPESFNYERHFFFESRAVELAISLY